MSKKGNGCATIIVIIFALGIVHAIVSPDEPQQQDQSAAPVEEESSDAAENQNPTTSKPASPPKIISLDEATKQLNYCITPKAQYGEYSSYDGGASAAELLNACPSETEQFIQSCSQDGSSTEKQCTLIAGIAAQVVIKSFDK